MTRSRPSRKKIREQVHRTITEQTYNQIKDCSREELIDLIIAQNIEIHSSKMERQILRNALYAASSEAIQLPLFDQETMESLEDSEESVERRIRQFREKQLEEGKIARDFYEEKIAQLDKRLKVLSSVQKDKKKSRKLRTCPTQTVLHPLTEETCPVCGSKLVPAGTRPRFELVYHPAVLEGIQHEYQTGVCPNHCEDEYNKAIIQTVEPEEPALIDKSPASESLVAGLVVEKFMNGTPLYRLEKLFDSMGFSLSRQTMSNMTQICFERYLDPLCEKIRSDFSRSRVIHMDETSIQCLELQDSHKLSAMIVGVTGEYESKQMSVYLFSEGKAQTFVNAMIGDRYHGVLMTDGLKAYENYASEKNVVKLNCMAHARRQFYQAASCRDDYRQLLLLLKKAVPNRKEKVIEFLEGNPSLNIILSVLTEISALYRIEKQFSEDPSKTREEARQALSLPIFKNIVSLAEEMRGGFEEGTIPYKAADYFLKRKEQLELYLHDGDYPIDNNRAERAVKQFVIARKNFLFTNTEAGARAAAGYMTLIESARQNRLNPYAYLIHVLRTLKYYKNQTIPEEILEELTPYSKKLPEEVYVQTAAEIQ